MRKTDLFNECYDRQGSPEEFKKLFCNRCRQPRCVLAGWADDQFGSRVSTQMDRLFNTNVADPNDPRFARLQEADFPNLLNQAIRLNIADKRGDWSLPESPEVKVVLSPIEGEPAGDESQELLEQAVKNLAGTQGEQVEASDSDTPKNPSQKPDKENEESFVEEPKPSKPQHFQDVKKSSAPQRTPKTRTLGNTEVPDEGLMVGGGSVPNKPPEPASDPWAIPTETILQPGAKVQMGKRPSANTKNKKRKK